MEEFTSLAFLTWTRDDQERRQLDGICWAIHLCSCNSSGRKITTDWGQDHMENYPYRRNCLDGRIYLLFNNVFHGFVG